jgi:DNA repair exonuclease SbcCD ATPase subunit
MYIIKKSIIGTQLILLVIFVGFVYVANAEEEISPQDRFKLMQEKAEAQRAEFEAKKDSEKNAFQARKVEGKKEFEAKKDAVAELGHTIQQQNSERINNLSTEKKASLREKQELRKEEIQEKAKARKEALQKRQQERIKNLAANVSNRMEAVTARLRQIIVRFQTRMDSLADTAVDISAAQEALNESSAHLDEAQALISGIDVLIAEVVSSESPRDAWTTAKAQYTEIKNHIKLAHSSLRTSLQLLKSAVERAKNPQPNEEYAPEEIIDPASEEAPTS